ncbi:MAG: GumC family protein [Bacillota bacterium]
MEQISPRESNSMEEISLRELIEILIRQRKLIVGVTLACLLVSYVFSFFVLDPVYESKAILMASSITQKTPLPEQAEGIEGLLDTLSQYPQMTIETYKEQINNPHILQKTIDELKLNELGITRKNLRDMITLNTIKDTNLISISVTYKDKKVAADIANTVAKRFTDFVSDNAKVQATKSSNFIKQQMEVEKKNLDQALLEYKDYLAKPRGKNELEKEVTSKFDLITQYKTDLVNTEIEIKKINAALAAAEQALKNTSDKILLNKSLSDEPYISQVVGENTGKTTKELYSVKVQTEEINDVYTALKTQENMLKIELATKNAQKSNLEKQIANTQKELEILQVDLAEKQHEEKIITQKVEFAQSTYNAFLEKYEETRIAKSSAIGDATIIIVSPAVEPIEPAGPRKVLNMAIAGVLGIMISVFLAFFIEYWKNSSVAAK